MAFELPSDMRERLVEDMLIRGYSEGTQRDYVRVVENFTDFLGGPPHFADVEDLRRYQIHLAVSGASPRRATASIRSKLPARL